MDTVLDCVLHYIHDANDRNSFSLVSHMCYDIDAKTRKHVTAHLCYATPLRFRRRFPFIESVTLAGNPHIVDLTSSACNWDHNLTPWVQEIATSFKGLKMVRLQNLVVHDSDLELLARTLAERLMGLEIDSCSGFSTDGLLYIGKYCNHLKILSLENSSISEKDGEWLHELALHNSSIESLDFYKAGLTKFDVKDLARVAKNCSQSLVSVKISEHYEFIDLVDFFSYAIKLEDFGGGRFGDNSPINHFGNNPFYHVGIDLNHIGIGMNQFVNNALGMNPILPFSAQQVKYKDFKFPLNLKYLALNHRGQKDIVLPFAHLITQLDTQFVYDRNHHHQHSLIENCPNLEVLYTEFISDEGLEHLSQCCKNLRKLYVTNRMGQNRRGPNRRELLTEKGLFALALGCRELECLHINLSCITFEAMVHIGINLKNLSDLSMVLGKEGVNMKDPVDNGVRTLLIGCNKLERLSICFKTLGGLSDIGLSYIGKFGCNLRYLSLSYAGESDAGLVELSFGCPKLKNLVINDCPFSKEAFDIFRCNVPSLRYFQVQGMPRHWRYRLEEDQRYFKQIV
ncbi:hypothetical protein CTI12_AA165890 [Artemisia annua]|uniref:COI1 F-box domain-containing protein n=1 Tax=Artemisia annua TaxID=35608 RepID=A0A2U1PCX0_ARTAN|nr:hypothetical protein CTI12_AA165890 [Artemisia annua]